MVHFSGNPNASLSEGEALAIVVGEVPEMPYQTRNGKHFRRPLRESRARLRLAGPPPARRGGAPHERDAGGVSDPPFFGAGAARGRGKWSTKWSTSLYPFGGSLTPQRSLREAGIAEDRDLGCIAQRGPSVGEATSDGGGNRRL